MKNLLNSALAICILLNLCCLFSCTETNDKTGNKTATVDSTQENKRTLVAVPNDDTIVKMVSKQVLTSLKAKDYKVFATFMHPILGVRFSPFALRLRGYDARFGFQGG